VSNGMVTLMLGPFVLATRECALQMMSNAAYILDELPNVRMPPELLERTRSVCNDLVGTKHDLISEIHEIDDLAGADASVAHIGQRVELIVGWVRDDLVRLHELVSALDAASRQDETYGLAGLLVMESATNLFNAFDPMQSAAEGVMRAVRGESLPGTVAR
jgi:hypothetical protein